MFTTAIIVGFLSMLLVPCALAFFGGRRKDDPETGDTGMQAGRSRREADPYENYVVDSSERQSAKSYSRGSSSRPSATGRLGVLEEIAAAAEDDLLEAHESLAQAQRAALIVEAQVRAARADVLAERRILAERSAEQASRALEALRRERPADPSGTASVHHSEAQGPEMHPSLDFPRRRGTHRAA